MKHITWSFHHAKIEMHRKNVKQYHSIQHIFGIAAVFQWDKISDLRRVSLSKHPKGLAENWPIYRSKAIKIHYSTPKNIEQFTWTLSLLKSSQIYLSVGCYNCICVLLCIYHTIAPPKSQIEKHVFVRCSFDDFHQSDDFRWFPAVQHIVLPSGYLSLPWTMAHRNRWFSELRHGEFPSVK